ncbi:MAG TPA: chromate resistance protein ChrB domain-containing protein [Candidatus Angelobacter sp.]|nr:chromate resistance protein ChrB domain-containing protein [Candidatus Angelobacter sp.]
MSARSKSPQPNHPPEWLLLVYQLPAKPSNIRVRTWRRLLQVGAVGLKNSAYVLPNTPQAKEDFEWIKAEIAAVKSQANLFLADHMDAATQEEITSAFRVARQSDFRRIHREAKKLLGAIKRRRAATPLHRKLERNARVLRERLNNILAIDFFHAPGRDEAIALLDESEALLAKTPTATKVISKAGEKIMPEKFRSQTWVTRPRPGVDRMSSGWLIRRFIDPEAKFTFAEKPGDVPRGVPFDMFGVRFSHEGNCCTFETLLRRFGISGQALTRIGQIVHNLDLKDEQFDVPEAIAVGRLIEGLRQIHLDDHKLLEEGMGIFEALYRSFTNMPPVRLRRKGPASYIGLS